MKTDDMLCKCYSATCIGLDVLPVTVEVSVTPGVGFELVGLPDSAVKESIARVSAALTGNGYRLPGKKTVVNMAPADLRKEGSAFDVAIGVGLLAASEQILVNGSEKTLIIGELSLDGFLRQVRGVLPIAMKACEMGFERCIFPREGSAEAADVEDIPIYVADTLMDVINILQGESYIEDLRLRSDIGARGGKPGKAITEDFCDVMGQETAKRGLEIAASGAHNLLLTGPPGAGKSFMARCLAGILPPMSRQESLETSMIYSVAGQLSGEGGLMVGRPFRSPHHTASLASLVGGGRNVSPGEISLAHNGVLYLDEINLFPSSVLDVLRQPLEERCISISRVRYKVKYPASFMLVGSMNPCPCGYYGFEDCYPEGGGVVQRRCTCSPGIIQRYRTRISGPLMDRIDLNVRVKPVESSRLVRGGKAESSEVIAERVAAIRRMQLERFAGDGIFTNSQMDARHLHKYCPLGREEKELCEKIMTTYSLTARSYSRILKVARTLADMAGSADIRPAHLLEAVQYRIT